MTDLGLLFHGYSKDNAQAIANFLSDQLGTQIHIFGAHGQDESTVQQILDGVAQEFCDGDPKVMMLLGFENDLVQVVLKQFPQDIPRPIFCGLTESNLTWTISHLVEHLLEEQEYWKEEARKKKEEYHKENEQEQGVQMGEHQSQEVRQREEQDPDSSQGDGGRENEPGE